MNIPNGYKLVPVEPTEHQMKIARSMTMQQEQIVGAEYRAMVRLSPPLRRRNPSTTRRRSGSGLRPTAQRLAFLSTLSLLAST